MKRAIICFIAFAGVCTVAVAQDTAKHKGSIEAIAVHQKADVSAPASGPAGATASTGPVKSKDTSTGSSTAKNINTSEDNLGTGKGNKAAPGATGASTTTSADDSNLGGRNAVGNGSAGLAAPGATGTTGKHGDKSNDQQSGQTTGGTGTPPANGSVKPATGK